MRDLHVIRGRRASRRGRAFLAVAVACAIGVATPATPAIPATAAADPIEGLRVAGSPFWPDGDGVRERLMVRLTLGAPATVDLRVEDFDGALVRRLARGVVLAQGSHRFRWGGRSRDGAPVPAGPYRVVATAGDTKPFQVVDAWATSAPGPIHPARPGAIVVAVDAGHGGTRTGAVAPDGTREADLNLDIALRLERMLQGSGVRVVMTRRTDTDVNEPPEDRNGDGLIDYDDELLARPELANLARADLFLSIHNNIAVNPRVGGPSTLYSPTRTFTARSRRLARAVQREVVAVLEGFADATWKPYDHGAVAHEYVILRPYAPPRITRPSLMPGALSEGVFLSHPHELELIQRPAVRGAIAAAYHAAIATWIGGRATAVRHRVVAAPETAEPGSSLSYRVQVRNTGRSTLAGAWLQASAVPAVPRYDGSGLPGEELGRVAIPELAPGAAATVTLEVTAPTAEGAWLVLLDTLTANGRRLSELGVVAVQLPLTTGTPPARRRR